MALGFFTDNNAPESYESMERKRRLAELLMAQSNSTAPVQSWTQGAARLAQALSGKIQDKRLDAREAETGKLFNDALMKALGGGSSAPVNPATASMATGGAAPSGSGNYRDAIASIESKGSGDYGAIGLTHPKLGRALGRYQVMEANIGPWSREALGREVTPDEFIKNPQIQDAIFDHKFGQYVQKYGNPQDAASAWFTGRPMAQGANASDALGTTGSAYVDKFTKALGQGGQPAPVQVASLDGLPPGPVPSNAPPMAYAPAQQAISNAAPPMPPPRPEGIGGAPMPAANAPAPNAAPAGPAPMQMAQAGGIAPSGLLQLALDPRFSPQQRQMAMQLYSMGQKQNPEFTKIGEDEFKRPIMGWVDPRTRSVVPVGNAPGMTQQAQGASDLPPAPPGVDPVKWREEWTKKKFEDARGPKSEDVTGLRKEVQGLPSYKNFAQAAPIYQAMTRAADVDSKAADLDLVYGLGKIFDPGSVVREGEMVMVNSTASLPDWLVGAINSLNGGQRLQPETRSAILTQAYNRIQAYQDQFKQDANMYRGIAGRQKMNVDDIIPNFGEFKPWTPKAKAAGTPNPNPRTMSDFTPDEIQAELKRRGLAQ